MFVYLFRQTIGPLLVSLQKKKHWEKIRYESEKTIWWPAHVTRGEEKKNPKVERTEDKVDRKMAQMPKY